MQIVLIPLMGPFHLRYPLYNSVTVKDMVKASQSQAVVTTVLKTKDFEYPQWQDTPEIALPQKVIPWVQQQQVPLYGVYEPSPDAQALEDFRRYANEYPKLNEQMRDVEVKLRPIAQKLEQSLDLERIQNEVLPLLHEYQTYREQVFGDGPGTDWLHARVKTMAQRILELPYQRLSVLASAEHMPFLQEILQDHLIAIAKIEPTEESRQRSLLDFAFRVDVPEAGNVIAQLRTLRSAETKYHQANLLLAHGHVLEALDILEQTSQGDFSQPYYLPGYVLARLGQLYDLAGQRNAALRCYKGVRALSYAPPEALEQALQGIERPFSLERAGRNSRLKIED
jgi:hypothetical protein